MKLYQEHSGRLPGLHGSHLPGMRRVGCKLVLLMLGVLVMRISPLFADVGGLAGYLPLHILLETLAIVIAMLVFSVAWNAHRREGNGSFLLIGCAFFGVAMLDFTHMLSYAGMPDFITPSSPEKAINFWLAARTLAAIVLLLATSKPRLASNSRQFRGFILGGILVLVGLLHWLLLFHDDLIPATFMAGHGLTPFKIRYEYGLVALSLITAAILWWHMRKPMPFDAAGLFGAVCTMALSEFLFTLYADVNDIYNLMGHVYKVIAYLFLYRAIFVDNFERPYVQLRASQEQLRFITDHIPFYLAQCDADKRYRFVNQSYAELFDLPPAGIVGKHPREILGEAAYTQARPHMEAALAGEASEYDLALTTPHGLKEFAVNYNPERDEAGHIVGFIAALSDITERKQTEARLRESEESLLESQRIAGLGSYLMDFRAGLWRSSAVFDQLFGIDAAYLRDITGWNALIHPDDRRGVAEYITGVIAEKSQSASREFRIVRHDDQSERWVYGLGKLEFDEHGQPLRLHGTIQDITARKQADDALRKLSLAVEQSPNSIVITDLQARIEYVNKAFSTVTGYTAEEVLGKNPHILQSGKTPQSQYDEMWAHLMQGKSWRGEFINHRKDGSEYIEAVLISPVSQADGRITNYLAIKSDITEAKQAAARIEQLAHFDQLTGLPNRTMLRERFRLALSLAQRNGAQLALMFLDLDRFKNINDTLGHAIGDQLLMEVAVRIKSVLREEDTVSRLGGDEFILIFPGADAHGAAHVASKLIEVISQSCLIEQHELTTTPSVGIAIYPNDGTDFETLSKNADAAMYRVKQEGRNNFRFFTPEMQAYSARNLQMVNALRNALARNELFLHYQPQLSIQDGHVVGAEALLRWQHPELGLISPAEFIPIAEDSGQIVPIGEWVLRTAVRQLKDWMAAGLPPMVMAVNLSAMQFHQSDIVGLVTRILDEIGLPHQYLELELTEAVAMNKPLEAIAVMDKLHEIGIRMSIDDFGTGYSSLSYLKKFKVYKLKIDQSFVRDLLDDPEDKAIVSAIINMASSLGIHTIAEGVETPGQLAYLRLQGCDEVQGYYFSKPLIASAFASFVRNGGGQS